MGTPSLLLVINGTDTVIALLLCNKFFTNMPLIFFFNLINIVADRFYIRETKHAVSFFPKSSFSNISKPKILYLYVSTVVSNNSKQLILLDQGLFPVTGNNSAVI